MEWIVGNESWYQTQADWLVVGVPQSDELPDALVTINERLDGVLTRLQQGEDLTGKVGEAIAVYHLPQIAAKRLLLVGLGKPAELDRAKLKKSLTTAARQISSKADRSVALWVPADVTSAPRDSELSAVDWAQTAATALTVGCVGQSLFRSEPERYAFARATVLAAPGQDLDTIRTAVERGRVLGEAINTVRELVNRPPSEIHPSSFADRANQIAARLGFDCTVWDEQRLRDERMHALLAVGAGSARPPRLVVLEYSGGDPGAPTLGLVGKGVTFDSGGLSLKSSDNMASMKGDMAGAATVLGSMAAIAELELPMNVTGFLGLVENMPSGSSYKLGDVLTARNGVTIEVQNTDAEGRLVLADVLSYAVDYGADKLIDLATLTGACVVALGERVTGVFTNSQPWCDTVLDAAKSCGEDVWQLPMFDQYSDLIKSDVADVKNVGGRWGGAITAAKFLEKFVGDRPWVHLDIAGPAFATNNKPDREGGATGCMLLTVVETAQHWAVDESGLPT